jgi:hypothetical protein
MISIYSDNHTACINTHILHGKIQYSQCHIGRYIQYCLALEGYHQLMGYVEGRWLLSEIINEISYNENSINVM